MIIDSRLQFCNATTVNTGTGVGFTYNIGDVVDSSIARDLGVGEPLYCIAFVTTAITSNAGAGTVVFKLVSDAANPPAGDATPTQHITSQSFATATTPGATSLTAGTVIFAQQLPIGSNATSGYERYLGIQQLTATNYLAAGAITAFITKDYATWRAYADAVTVGTGA
jgi:hypothetical protein